MDDERLSEHDPAVSSAGGIKWCVVPLSNDLLLKISASTNWICCADDTGGGNDDTDVARCSVDVDSALAFTSSAAEVGVLVDKAVSLPVGVIESTEERNLRWFDLIGAPQIRISENKKN